MSPVFDFFRIKPWFSTGGDLTPRGHLARSVDIFGLGGRMLLRVEARGAQNGPRHKELFSPCVSAKVETASNPIIIIINFLKCLFNCRL